MKLVASSWLLLLAAILVTPAILEWTDPGDNLIRNTVRLSLLYYIVAAALMLRLRPNDWIALTARGRLARWCWTLAWAFYVLHVGLAFHFAHGWSHAHAVETTRQRSGFGAGIYVSHLFTLVWTADVLAWWLRPRWVATRNPWLDRGLHGFMFFMIFNATVVFEDGPIRWAGVALVAGLAALWLGRRTRTELGLAKDSSG